MKFKASWLLLLACLLVGGPGCNEDDDATGPERVEGEGPRESEPDVGGPTEEVQALWAAVAGDDRGLAGAVNRLTAWFERDGKHLLDRPVDYSFIESVALDDLRAVDVEGLANVGWDPLAALSTDHQGLGTRLAAARGLLATSIVTCDIDAVSARIHPRGELHLVESADKAVFADQSYARTVVAGTRAATLDIDGALTRAIVELRVQVVPAELGGISAKMTQRWQLDLWLERTESTTLRLRTDWIEVSSPLFGPDSRVWVGWVLHDAFQQAEDWNRFCADPSMDPSSEEPTAPAKPGPVSSPVISSTAPGTTPSPVVSTPSASGQSDLASHWLAPICEGVRLIEIAPWALRLVKTEHTFSALVEGSESRDLRMDQQAIDAWVEDGVQSWCSVLRLDPRTIVPDDRTRLRHLVERFGAEPRLFGRSSRERFRVRWSKGLLRELLGKDPVLVPVCPSSLEHTGEKIGYPTPEQRQRKRAHIDQITAVALLEHGSVQEVGDDEWQAIREELTLGDAVQDMLSRPARSLGPADSKL